MLKQLLPVRAKVVEQEKAHERMFEAFLKIGGDASGDVGDVVWRYG